MDWLSAQLPESLLSIGEQLVAVFLAFVFSLIGTAAYLWVVALLKKKPLRRYRRIAATGTVKKTAQLWITWLKPTGGWLTR